MYRTACLLLLLAASCFAAPPTLMVPVEVKGEPGAFIAIEAQSDAAWVNFKAEGLNVFPSGLLTNRKATVVTAAKAGRYKITAYTGNEDGGIDAEIIVIVGAPGPSPVDPPAPVDPVEPTPVTPTKELRVILACDIQSDNDPYDAVLFSAVLRDWLNENTAKDAAGGKGWRLYDDAQVVTPKESEPWKKAWSAVQPKLTADLLPAFVVLSGLDAKIVPMKSAIPAEAPGITAEKQEQAAIEYLKKYKAN